MFSRQGSIHLFKLWGIDVFIHWTWFLALYVWFTFSGAGDPVMFALSYAGLFAIVLMHEFGHALACRSVGGQARTIVLWPLGGVAFVQPPPRPLPILWSIVAGPLVNVALILPLYFLASWNASPGGLGYFGVLFYANIIMLVFNLIPVFPLDGGQILRSILWLFIGPGRSLRATSVIGLMAGAAAVVFALLRGDLFLVLIGAFIAWQAWSGYRQARQMVAAEDQQAHEKQLLDARIRELYGVERERYTNG